VERKRYSRKFQRMAVARMETCEDVGELARELGVRPRCLYKWRRKLEMVEPGQEASRPSTHASAHRKEIHRLKQLLAEKTGHATRDGYLRISPPSNRSLFLRCGWRQLPQQSFHACLSLCDGGSPANSGDLLSRPKAWSNTRVSAPWRSVAARLRPCAKWDPGCIPSCSWRELRFSYRDLSDTPLHPRQR